MRKTLLICAALALGAALAATSASADGIKLAPGAKCRQDRLTNKGVCSDRDASVATVKGRGSVLFTITGHITVHAENASVLVDLEHGEDMTISGDNGFVSSYRGGLWSGRYTFAHHLDLYATCPHVCRVWLVSQTSFAPHSWPLATSYTGTVSGTGSVNVLPALGMHSPSITTVDTNDGGHYLLADIAGYSAQYAYSANELDLGIGNALFETRRGGTVRTHFRHRLAGDLLTALEMQRAAFDPSFTANFPIPTK